MTDETAVAVREQDEIRLDAYGGRPEIREMSKRLMAMLPSVKQLGSVGAMALAQAALAMGLNPFIGEVWAIPQDRTGKTFAIMPGIKGIRRKAREQTAADNGYYTVSFRSARPEEVEGLIIGGGDIVRACDLRVVGDRALKLYKITGAVPCFTGIGVYRHGESTKMMPLHVARKRAEADALKQAFDIPLPMLVTGYADAQQPIDRELLDEFSEYAPPDQYLEGYFESADYEPPSGTAAEAIADLFDDDVPEPVQKSTPKQASKGNGRPRSFHHLIIEAIVDAGYAKNPPNAVRMLNLSTKLGPGDDVDTWLTWAKNYREARAELNAEDSAAMADSKVELPEPVQAVLA